MYRHEGWITFAIIVGVAVGILAFCSAMWIMWYWLAKVFPIG